MVEEQSSFTPEEIDSIKHYVSTVPQYVSTMWDYLCQISNSRINDDLEEMSRAGKLCESVWGMLAPDMRRLVERPGVTVGARIKDTKNYGFKALGFKFTEWELAHATMSERQKDAYREDRLAKIYDDYLLSFVVRVTDLFASAGILMPSESRMGQEEFPTMESFMEEAANEEEAGHKQRGNSDEPRD